ncbi:DNA repair protein XRCC2 homolog isoform X2 [Cornus florida]|uniref:DNA repair protein XRCC2 homolog isoform X2 n=1 Tax=Cornus florida TaxID=4283 RepID=UPI0028A287B5|nr:DNA repair protein XRCC2 homolog isoform X2 [Cornus florida]
MRSSAAKAKAKGKGIEWIEGDESAKEMLARVLRERPLLLIPPLHRVPLRVGNVVEIVGPSPSAKTQILIEAAISCILPKEWNGVHYGGLERLVMFFDLNCRFDIVRLSQSLKHRIVECNGSRINLTCEQNDVNVSKYNLKEPRIGYDKELFAACMRRFLHVRCYDSMEFLSTLKTLHYQLQKEKEAHGVGVHFLMIDSIGAFHWIDRASTSLPLTGKSRKSFSFQNVSETVVQEIRKLLLVHPMLVLATKAANLGDKYSTKEVNSPLLHTEYLCELQVGMKPTCDDGGSSNQNHPIYLSEWLLPPLSLVNKFIIRDLAGWRVNYIMKCILPPLSLVKNYFILPYVTYSHYLFI